MVSIFVGNLSWATTPQDLRSMFAPFGCLGISVAKNAANGQPRGYAMVAVAREKAALAIAQLHGTKLRGRLINVRQALPEAVHPLSRPTAEAGRKP